VRIAPSTLVLLLVFSDTRRLTSKLRPVLIRVLVKKVGFHRVFEEILELSEAMIVAGVTLVISTALLFFYSWMTIQRIMRYASHRN